MEDLRKAIESNPSMGLDFDLNSAIQEVTRDMTRKIDAACVVAQEKNCGVKVTMYYNTAEMVIEVTDEVPAGEIHYHDKICSEGEFESL